MGKRPEEIILEMNRSRNRITTNQLRKLLSGINLIANKIQMKEAEGAIEGDKLPRSIVSEIDYLRIKHVYQCGRDKNVKAFDDMAGILKQLESIGSSKQAFIDFNRYVEELVAYNKFHGGN